VSGPSRRACNSEVPSAGPRRRGRDRNLSLLQSSARESRVPSLNRWPSVVARSATARDMSSDTSRDQCSAVLKGTGREYCPVRMSSRLCAYPSRLIGLTIGAAELAKVIHHDVSGNVMLRRAWRQWLLRIRNNIPSQCFTCAHGGCGRGSSGSKTCLISCRSVLPRLPAVPEAVRCTCPARSWRLALLDVEAASAAAWSFRRRRPARMVP
jgi:hypothetical protein